MSVFSLLKDVEILPKVVVIVDVFRSSNTIIEMLEKGAKRVIPVSDMRESFFLKNKNKNWLIFGERNGVKLKGFDGDNSPILENYNLHGKTTVLTTSGGTQAVNACSGRHDVYFGSFANANALIEEMRVKHKKCDVGFWAVGVKGETVAIEDELCSQYLDLIWNGRYVNFSHYYRSMMNCEGAIRLRKLKQFKDLEYCTKLNSKTVVPKLDQYNNKLWNIKR